MTKIEDMSLDELSQVLIECQKALAELKESKKEGKWKPELEEIYWVRNSGGESMCVTWFGTSSDYWRYNNIPIFQTKTECERYCCFMDTVKEKSYEFSKEEWEDEELEKYYICYDYKRKIFHSSFVWDCQVFGRFYFKTEEDAEYIINNFKEELLEYWL